MSVISLHVNDSALTWPARKAQIFVLSAKPCWWANFVQASGTLSVLHDLEKRPIISENVNISTQETRVQYKPHGVIFLLYWIWFLNSFLGKSSGCNFPLASYMDNIFTSPIRFAASFTFTAEHIMPCIVKSYVLGETSAPDCKLEAGVGLCRSAVCDMKQVLWIGSVTCILIGFKPTTFSFPETLLCESHRSFTHSLILCFIDSLIH